MLKKAHKVMVVMPFHASFLAVYNTIELVCTRLGIACTRPDKEPSGEVVIEKIQQQIRDADIVIADLTNGRANVMYEIGYAQGNKPKRPYIMIVQKPRPASPTSKADSGAERAGTEQGMGVTAEKGVAHDDATEKAVAERSEAESMHGEEGSVQDEPDEALPRVPFDVAAYQHIYYDYYDLGSFENKLSMLLQELVGKLGVSPQSLSRLFDCSFPVTSNPRVYLPVFYPKGYDNTEADSSRYTQVRKGGNRKGGDRKDTEIVPMYSDTIVWDDYQAYRELAVLFADQGFGFLDHARDDVKKTELYDWPGAISIGGPRGNRVTNRILHFSNVRKMLEVKEPEAAHVGWRLELTVGKESLVLGPSPRQPGRTALGLMVRARDPAFAPHPFVGTAIFGDRAESTIGMTRHLGDKFQDLAEHIEGSNQNTPSNTDPIVIIVGFTGKNLGKSTTLVVATNEGLQFTDDEVLSRFDVGGRRDRR